MMKKSAILLLLLFAALAAGAQPFYRKPVAPTKHYMPFSLLLRNVFRITIHCASHQPAAFCCLLLCLLVSIIALY